MQVVRPTPTWVFHFTRIEHLPTIIESGLYCDRRAQTDGLLAIEVGNTGIKTRRLTRNVPVPPGGTVGDYVPFYFAPRSPMMFAIHKGNVPGYSEGAGRLIYLATTMERLTGLGLDVVLTDRNAVLDYAAFVRLGHGEPEDSFIDWPLMKQTMWKSTDDDPDRMERRMAECLVHGSVPWGAFMHVGAKSETVADEVKSLLGAMGSRPSVSVRRGWYF